MAITWWLYLMPSTCEGEACQSTSKQVVQECQRLPEPVTSRTACRHARRLCPLHAIGAQQAACTGKSAPCSTC